MTKTVTIKNLGSVGIVHDQTPISLPPEAWTDGSSNVRFAEGEVRNMPGYVDVTLAGGETGLYYMLPYRTNEGQQAFILCEADALHTYQADDYDDVTSAVAPAWTVSNNFPFTGVDFNGVPVINRRDHCPLYLPIGGAAFLELPWDSGNGWDDEQKQCLFMRRYKEVLIAGGIWDSATSTNYPHEVRWSSIAEVGGIPASWDETDATYNAGRKDASSSPGPVLDGLAMGEAFVLYKSDSVVRMDYVGPPYMFDFNPIAESPGLVGTNCVVDIGGPHIGWFRQGPMIFDGTDFRPLAYGRTRAALVDDPSDFVRAFVAHHKLRHEVWFCYSTAGSFAARCDTAWVYNYADNTWTTTTLPDNTSILWGGTDLLGPGGNQWGAVVGVESESYLENSGYAYVGIADGACVLLDTDPRNAGAPRECVAEKRGLILGDQQQVNQVIAIWPQMKASTGNVTIYVGTQDHPEDSATWDAGHAFTPGTDRKIDCRATGAIHAVKFVSEKNMNWILTGYMIEFVPMGNRPTG